MATEAGKAYVSVEFKTDDVDAKVRALGSQVERGFSATTDNVGRHLTGLGTKLSLGVTAPISAFAAVSFDAFATFDKTIRQVGVQTDQSGRSLDTLRQLALQMGKDTVYSAGQAADAMLALAKGGMSSAQIQAGGLQQTLTLAAAGGLDLSDAATIMSNTLNTFGLSASDAGKVAAALAGGANASTASVESLGQALSQVGPGAKLAGLSMNETVAALAAFDNAGIKGSDAGTSLKTMLQNLVPTTKSASAEMKALGLNFTDAHGRFLPLDQVAEQLRTHLSGLTSVQQQNALTTIFGTDAYRAAAVLMNNGAAGVDKYEAATRNLSAAQQLAQTNTEGASGAVEQMSGSVETAEIALGQALAPSVVSTANHITDLANAFAGLDPHIQHTVAVSAAAAAAIGPAFIGVGATVRGVSSTIDGVTATLTGLGKAGERAKTFSTQLSEGFNDARVGMSGFAPLAARIGVYLKSLQLSFAVVSAATGLWTAEVWANTTALLANPITWIVVAIVAAIAALVAGVIYAYQHWGAFRDAVDAVGRALAAFGSGVISGAVSAFHALASGAQATWSAVQAGIGLLGSGLAAAFHAVMGAAQTAWSAIQTGAAVLGSIISTVAGIFARVANVITQPLQGVVQVVTGIVQIIVGVFTGNLGRVEDGIANVFGGVVRFFLGMPARIIAAVLPLVPMLLSWAGQAFTALGGAIATGVSAAVGFFAALPGRAIGAAAALGSMLVNLGRQALSALGAAVSAGVSAAVAFLAALPGRAVSAASALGSRLVSLGRQALSALGSAISAGVAAAASFFASLPGRAVSFLSSLPGRLTSAGHQAMTALASAITSGGAAVLSFFTGLPGRVRSALGSLGGMLASAGRDLINGMVSGIQSAAGSLAQAAKDTVHKAVNAAKSALGIHSPSTVFATIGQQSVDGLVAGLAAAAPRAVDAVGQLADSITAQPVALGGVVDLDAVRAARAATAVAATYRLEQAAPTGTDGGDTYVRVFLGDRELTDLVRVETSRAADAQARRIAYGRRF